MTKTVRGIDDVLELIGDRVSVVHGMRDDEIGGGGDIDCIVRGLDPIWPLRLTNGWRLCQNLRHDTTGAYWVFDHAGCVVPIDTLDDPQGIGKYRFPTDIEISPGARAAYLTSKRIRKNAWDADSWAFVAELAREDVVVFEDLLGLMFGEGVGRRLADCVRSGGIPPRSLRRAAMRQRAVRLLCRPTLLLRFIGQHIARVAARAFHPTGLVVAICGPDGTGKSTLAGALPELCEGLFRRYAHLHWRPGLLPRPGALAMRAERDTGEPGSAEPHGILGSFLLLLYFFADFAFGGIVLLAPARRRTTLVVIERSWWDIVVDPRRYRLRPLPRLVRGLGALLPRPDVFLMLEGDAAAIHARKPELTECEIERQARAWHSGPPRRAAVVRLTGTADEVATAARESVVELLNERAVRRVGRGWAAVPSRRDARWIVPRGGPSARASLAVYQPVTARAQVGWRIARSAAGVLRATPRVVAEPEVRERLAQFVPRGGTYALSVSRSHDRRSVALILDRCGGAVALAKLALTPAGAEQLACELTKLEQLAPYLPKPLKGPELLAAEDGLLVFRPVQWSPRLRPWRLEPEVARAVGAFAAASGAAHGDFAPWNLLRSRDGWTLVDWEYAHGDADPFEDLLHHLVSCSQLLGRPSPSRLSDELDGEGWIGRAVAAYATGAGLDRRDVRAAHERFVSEWERKLANG